MKTKTINLVQEFGDLKTAIENSKEAYGLTAYAPSELKMKISNHARAGINTYFLTDEKEIIYFHTPPREMGTIVSKFSWIGCMHDGAAAVCALTPDKKKLMIGEYKYKRDELRKMVVLWTVDSL